MKTKKVTNILDQKFGLVSFSGPPFSGPFRFWQKVTVEVSKYLVYSCLCSISNPTKAWMLLLSLTTDWLKTILSGLLFKRCDSQIQPSSVCLLPLPTLPLRDCCHFSRGTYAQRGIVLHHPPWPIHEAAILLQRWAKGFFPLLFLQLHMLHIP